MTDTDLKHIHTRAADSQDCLECGEHIGPAVAIAMADDCRCDSCREEVRITPKGKVALILLEELSLPLEVVERVADLIEQRAFTLLRVRIAERMREEAIRVSQAPVSSGLYRAAALVEERADE